VSSCFAVFLRPAGPFRRLPSHGTAIRGVTLTAASHPASLRPSHHMHVVSFVACDSPSRNSVRCHRVAAQSCFPCGRPRSPIVAFATVLLTLRQGFFHLLPWRPGLSLTGRLLARQRRAVRRVPLPPTAARLDSDCSLLPIYRVFGLFLFSVHQRFRFGHDRHRAPPAMSFRGINRG
jgi:hypothetical protein